MRIRIHNFAKVAAVCLMGLFVAIAGRAQNPNEPDMNEMIEGFSFPGTPLENVLAALADLTGRAILRPQALPTPEITFDPGGPISRGDLILALETVLSLNNIGVSPLGDRFLKVVPLGAIRTEAPELVTQSLKDRAPSGQVVSKLFRLQYLDSQTFQQQIQPFLSPGFGSIIPFQNSNAVIVTDTVSNLQRFEYVVSEVDKPFKLNIETVFYTLQYAEAAEVAQRIQGMIDDARNRFGNQNSQGSNNVGNRAARRETVEPPPPAISGGGAEGEFSAQVLFGSNTAITSDERTNQLILITDPTNLKFFEDIIKKLDVKADPSTRIEVIPLKHADAEEVASLLADFVSGRSRNETTGRNSANSRANSQNRANRTSRNATFGDTTVETPAPQQTQTPTAATTANATASAEERDSQFSSYMTIKADERSNSLVVSGTRNDLELIRALVDQIDVLLAQVRIEVIIAEVNLNENEGLRRGMDAFGFTYDQTDANGDKITLGDSVNFLGLGLGGTTFNYEDGVISNLTLDAVFNTVRSNENVKLLSQPTLVTTHNKQASIIVGESRPIITSSQTSSVTDSIRSSVQYQDIAIELIVTPLIGPNNVIQLEIDQKIDNVAGNVRIDNNDQPVIRRRQATSYVSVADGQLVILGGLQTEDTTKGVSKSAFLGEIPVLGRLFSSKRNETKKSELMVFIRPKVIRTTDDVNRDASDRMDSIDSKGDFGFSKPGEEPQPTVEQSDEKNYGARPKGIR